MSNVNEKEENEPEVPEGASTLLGLFAPTPADAVDTSMDVEDASESNRNKESSESFTPTSLHTTRVDFQDSFVVRPDAPTTDDSSPASAARRRSTLKSSNSSQTQENVDQAIHDLFRRSVEEEKKKPQLYSTRAEVPSPDEYTSLLKHRKGEDSLETTAFGDLLQHQDNHQSTGFSFSDLFVSSSEPTPKTSGGGRKQHSKSEHERRASVAMPKIQEDSTDMPPLPGEPHQNIVVQLCQEYLMKPTTYVGAGMFLLYHIVFCLALGSAIQRPSSDTQILGLMAKMAASGVIFAAPVYIFFLGSKIPALYPTADLFLAPFLAHIARIVDQVVVNDDAIPTKDETQVFLATFAVLSGIGMLISGTLLILAAKFKLANLGSFLPYPVLCGFFSAVALLMWSLAFAVDTSGKGVGAVFGSGDLDLICNSLIHHLPSFGIAVMMKYFGPKNPFYVSMLVIGTIFMFYLIMLMTGTSLEEAREQKWFWSHDDLVYKEQFRHFGFDAWAPPAPFGVLNSLLEGKVHWGAVMQGSSTVLALAFLYLLRCSIHGISLKKNVSNLVRIERGRNMKDDIPSPPTNAGRHSRAFSEALDIEAVQATMRNGHAHENVVRAKNYNVPLGEILLRYGQSHYMSALVGSFGVAPSVAAAPTMYSVGAEGKTPQYGSLLLLTVFYLTDFRLVSYIPKAAFSCLIVLASIDIILSWFLRSFQKTNDKLEWAVVPIIVVFAFLVGLLNAVFLGIAISTFIFVAAFFRSGVVKFLSGGCSIRSTIERSIKSASWLDKHGDLIQIVVLQNYLFFGNASSIQNYITTMFKDPEFDENDPDADLLSSKPRFVILDFTLVTGMDTSTVDVISEIKTQCNIYGCKLFLAGLSSRLRNTMSLGGVKPEMGPRSKRMLRFFSDLDSALGKAEDMLLAFEEDQEKIEYIGKGTHRRLLSEGDNGFRFALRQIDEQHARQFASGLVGLYPYTKPLELAPGESLFRSDGGPVKDTERGLFFIEQGIMKIERAAGQTLPRAGSSQNLSDHNVTSTLTKMNARRLQAQMGSETRHFRLARIGPGWIVGTHEGVCGMQNPGHHVAVSHCRLHQLPFSKMQEIEETNPVLALRLYKLLSHLMGRRHEIAVDQLATIHSIMTSPPLGQPVDRSTQKTMFLSARESQRRQLDEQP